ncbi:MAG: NlpC/P60 family protein [Paenibacillaceae bacterium]
MKRLFYAMFITMLAVLILLSGCMNMSADKVGQGKSNQGQQAQGEESGAYRVRNMDIDNGNKVIQTNEQAAVIPILNHQGLEYISLRKLTEVLEFQLDWNPETQRLRVGDNDVAYEISTNSKDALVEDEVVNMANPPVTIEGVTYIPRDAVETIFGEAMNYTWTTRELRIQPNEDMSLEEAEKLPDFQDDPNDPNKESLDTSFLSTEVTTGFGDLALTNVNSTKLIQTAKKYIGVKYVFGAGPYPRTKRFDCSTFTQYVYGKYNVNLPRLSRTQAKKGVSVSRTNLRKGDLMFFYLPGRYKSNKIVGHVGIYMGNGKMIHSSTKPKNGVQITSINKDFWKKTYLKSRRVAS